MRRSVVKIGGSVLRRPQDMARVIDIVRKYRIPPIIVVSAFEGVTDSLQSGSGKSASERSFGGDEVEFLRKKAWDFLVWPENVKKGDAVSSQLEARLHSVNRLYGLRSCGDIDGVRRQMILSYGERIASLVITDQLQRAGISAREALPDEIGLIIKDSAGGATIDIDTSRSRLRHALDGDRVIVVPGFFGITPSGVVKLLGRNGSDYSAAGIAACIDAASLDLYKDVPGICTGDPSMIGSIQTVPKLTYAEAGDIAHFGGNVLHSSTIEPLTTKRISIHIYGPYRDAASRPDTIVSEKFEQGTFGAKAVVCLPDIGVIELERSNVIDFDRVMRQVLASPTARFIKALNMTPAGLQLMIKTEEISETLDILKSCLSVEGAGLLPERRALIAMVGKTSEANAGISGQLIGALHSNGLDTKIMSIGSSPVSTYVTVRQADRVSILETLHNAIFVQGIVSDMRVPDSASL